MNPNHHLAGLRTLIWFHLGRLKQGGSIMPSLNPEAQEYLQFTNPRLIDLQRRYGAMKTPPHSCWSTWERCLDLRRFRAENAYQSQAYVFQTLARYRLTTAYVETLDEHGWLRSLGEDGQFGAKLWPVARDFVVTRDVLDSVLELTWLKESLNWGLGDTITLLDVGSGYGRIADRFVHAFPQGRVTCVDAIATSTFLCEFYLRHRQCERSRVLALDEIGRLEAGKFTLATNIHCWSEMPLSWIRFWLDLLSDLRVPYLFLVPNFNDLRTKEIDGSYSDFGPELVRHGYHCVLKTRKYRRSSVVDELGIFPADYYLFKRS
jgi:hypothetical protein